MHPEAVHGIVHSEDPNVPLSFLFLLLLYRIHYHMQRPLDYGDADIISDTVHEVKDGWDTTQRMQTGVDQSAGGRFKASERQIAKLHYCYRVAA